MQVFHADMVWRDKPGLTPEMKQRFATRISVQNALKGEIPEHFECFRFTLSQSHGYNTRNGGPCSYPDYRSNGLNEENDLLPSMHQRIGHYSPNQ
jgi:hypothetical protein